MVINRVIFLFSFIFVLNIDAFANTIKDLKEAIDVAGKQRMLTQRFVKDYVMIGMKVTYKDPLSDLKKSMQSFDDAIKSLEEFNKDKNILESLKSVETKFNEMKSILEATPSEDKLKDLSSKCDTLLKQSNDIVTMLSKQKNSEINNIINISGRQRMLSQKLASLYFIKSWGIKDIKFKNKLNKNIKLFKDSLDKLSSYKKNSPKINSLLSEVKSQFRFFEVMSRSNSRFIPSLIYKKSDDILKDMDKITKLYTKLQ